MRNRDAFSGYHPTVCFLYFTLVLMLSMCLMHPVYLAISLTGALAYAILLKGRKAVRFAVMGLLPMAALAALVNPALPVWPDSPRPVTRSVHGAALYPEIQGTAASRIRSTDMYWKGHENRQRIPPRRKCHSDFFHYGHMEPGKRD